MLLTFTACNACVVSKQPEAHQPTDAEQARAAVESGQGAWAPGRRGKKLTVSVPLNTVNPQMSLHAGAKQRMYRRC